MKDITLIGAGPAGSAAALLLARRGWNVTLIEQHRFPRDKVCGECVSALGVQVLERLSLAGALRNAGAMTLNRAIIHGAEGQSITTPLPRAMMGISRYAMDSLLLDAARNAGALVRQPVRCEGVFLGGDELELSKSAARHPAPSGLYAGERPGVRGDLFRKEALPGPVRRPLTPALSPGYRGEGAGDIQMAHPRKEGSSQGGLCLADARRSANDLPPADLRNDELNEHRLSPAGRQAEAGEFQPAHLPTDAPNPHALTIRLRDLERNKVELSAASLVILADGKAALAGDSPPATGDMGIKTHWIDVDGPRDAIELFGCRGCYGGLAAIEGNRWNSAFSVPARRLRDHRGDIDSLLAELMQENDSLARRLSGAKRVGPWLAAALPRFGVQKKWPLGVIPIGNAAAAVEPIGGEGMGLALHSAELAVEMLSAGDGHWTHAHGATLQRKYRKLWRARRSGCRALARVVSSPLAMDVIASGGLVETCLPSLALAFIGKF